MARQQFERRSRQMAAFRLATGIDLSAALASTGPERTSIVIALTRIIERERLRGARRHWSYDLNRHIALKQVLDELTGRQKPLKIGAASSGSGQTKNGAPRRRLPKHPFAG